MTIKKENPLISYPGSPIPLRFSETGNKIINYLTFKNNTFNREKVSIPIFRELKNN